MSHPALKHAPKTPLEAVRRMRAHLDSGKARGNIYSNRDCACIIGTLFTPPQLDDLKSRRLNGHQIGDVAKIVGKDNIEAMTCLPIDDLCDLQASFDTEYNDWSIYGIPTPYKQTRKLLDRLEKRYARHV